MSPNVALDMTQLLPACDIITPGGETQARAGGVGGQGGGEEVRSQKEQRLVCSHVQFPFRGSAVEGLVLLKNTLPVLPSRIPLVLEFVLTELVGCTSGRRTFMPFTLFLCSQQERFDRSCVHTLQSRTAYMGCMFTFYQSKNQKSGQILHTESLTVFVVGVAACKRANELFFAPLWFAEEVRPNNFLFQVLRFLFALFHRLFSPSSLIVAERWWWKKEQRGSASHLSHLSNPPPPAPPQHPTPRPF